MQFINTRSPLRPDQLASLYQNGDPGLSSQAQGWVSDQASNMGITGGVGNYFAGQRQDNWNALAAHQGRAVELARLGGADMSPDGIRDAQVDRAIGASQIATLQRQQALQQPLPNNPATDPNNYLEQHGISPAQRRFATRLGGVAEGQQFIGDNTSALDPDHLTRDPRFEALMTQSPEKAAHVFAALTGGDLTTHLKTKAARLKDQDQFGMNTMQDWAKSGRASFDAKTGRWKMRQLVPDPLNPERLVVGADYTDPDAFQSTVLDRYGSEVAPHMAEEIARKKVLESKAAAEQAVAQQSRDTAAGGLPGVFQTPKFAALQQSNPNLASSLWYNNQPAPRAPEYPAAQNRYSLNPDLSFQNRR